MTFFIFPAPKHLFALIPFRNGTGIGDREGAVVKYISDVPMMAYPSDSW